MGERKYWLIRGVGGGGGKRVGVGERKYRLIRGVGGKVGGWGREY